MPHVSHTDSQGNRLPSVTELKGIFSQKWLDNWRKSICGCPAHKKTPEGLCGYVMAERVSEPAKDIGRNVHAAIEEYLKGLMES